jgi:integrase
MGLELIKRGPSGHWHAYGSVHGQRVRRSTQTHSREDARRIADKWAQEIIDRITLGAEATCTFAEACAHYIRTGGEVRFLEPLVRRWGEWRIAAITQAEVAKAAHELYPGCKASHHVRAVYTPLIAVLHRAHRAQMVPAVPLIEKPSVARPRLEYADDAWLATVLPHCHARLACLLMFLTLTGSRISEAIRLDWSDVDFDAGAAILHTTKTGQPRRLPLSPEMLEALRRLAEGYYRPGRVFGYSDRGSYRSALRGACKRAGVKYLSSHKFGRHAFAARLLRDGHSLPVVQAAGGWASGQMVTQVYGHLEQSHVDQAVRSARIAPPRK